MPGISVAPTFASVGTAAGMKRAFHDDAPPSYRGPPAKKRKVTRQLHHTQPVHDIREPLSAELDFTGQSKDFFDKQLQRAIAIELKAVGYDGARPEAMEQFRGVVDQYMRGFLSDVRKSMASSRRTATLPHDWVYALTSAGIRGSSSLEPHLDTGEIPTSLLQPRLTPPDPPEKPPPDLEGLLGAELSGRADKESKKYIPPHFPAFPALHTWKATPVFTQRETDPRKIRERATEEGIQAEQSLRKLMAARKAGMQGDKARKQKRSKRMKQSDSLWKAAMEDLLETEEREEAERRVFNDGFDDDEFEEHRDAEPRPLPGPRKRVNLDETVHVNYDQKFWRRSARGS